MNRPITLRPVYHGNRDAWPKATPKNAQSMGGEAEMAGDVWSKKRYPSEQAEDSDQIQRKSHDRDQNDGKVHFPQESIRATSHKKESYWASLEKEIEENETKENAKPNLQKLKKNDKNQTMAAA